MKRSVIAGSIVVPLALLLFVTSCAKVPTDQGVTATPTPDATPTATTIRQVASLTGAIFRGRATGTGANAHVDTAIAASGYEVYVRRRGAADWIGPVITDTYGRFVFTSLPPGRYQARAYTGAVRIWEQIVDVPSVIPSIVARDVTVLYYQKVADNGRVEAALETLGFPYEKKTPQNQDATNAVFFGNGVQPDEVKLLAGALVRAGVRLQWIHMFVDNSGPKAKQIEVEADKLRKNYPALTVERINAMRDFTRP